MSTIGKIVELVDQLRENAFPLALKVGWISELDALVALEVMKLDVSELEQFQYDPETDLETQPLVRFPHDNIYHYWLCAKIDAENGEYNRYQNSMQLYNGAYLAYRTWFSRVYDVYNGDPREHGWYLSAYGLAVQQGYEGTLDEWLASLHGGTGDKTELRYTGTTIQWRQVPDAGADDPEEGWQDLIDMDDMRADVVEETLSEAEASAERAEAAAESAQSTATTAAALAGQAADASGAAQAAAEDAAQSASAAQQYAANLSADYEERISTLEGEIAELKYVEIEITSISNSVGVVEMGLVVNNVDISWTLNKEPVSQTVNGEAVEADDRSATLEGLQLTESKSFAVTATDERGETASASTAVTFCNGVYYGVVADGVTIDSTAILALTRKLQGSKGLTFTADAGEGERLCYAVPTRYGTPTINIGGFDYEWEKTTIEFTNASGYAESYDVWTSPQTGLGETTVKIS